MLAACAPAVESRAAADYAGRPKRMLVVATEGSDSMFSEWRAMQDGIVRNLGARGVTVELNDISSQVAADRVVAGIRNGAAAAGYDAVMRIRPVGSVRQIVRYSSTTLLQAMKYEALVTEQPSGRAVFRGQFYLNLPVFRASGSGGARAAADLVAQLAKDGTIRNCPATASRASVGSGTAAHA